MNRITTYAVMALSLAVPASAQTTGDHEVDAYIAANRHSNVLLEQGATQSTLSFSVGMTANDFGIGSFAATQATASVALSYGLGKRLEVFADIPVSWTRSTQTFLEEESSTTETSGNVTVGMRTVVAYETDSRPEFVLSAGFSQPLNGQAAEQAVILGLDAYRLIDPVLLNFGFGGVAGVETGAMQLAFRGGIDFAVSDRIGLGFDANWVSEGDIFDDAFGDALRDGLTFTASVSITTETGDMTVEPYISIGASEGATDGVLGVSLTRRW
jgi:hypothetical protein